MKYCTKCGKELLDESEICTGCGCFTGTLIQSTQNKQNEQFTREKKQRIKTEQQIHECTGKCAKDSKTIAILNFFFSFKAILAVFCLFLSVANSWVDLEFYGNTNNLYAIATFNLETACAVFAFLFSLFAFIFGVVVFFVSLVKPKCRAILSSLTRLMMGLFLCILSIVFLSV